MDETGVRKAGKTLPHVYTFKKFLPDREKKEATRGRTARIRFKDFTDTRTQGKRLTLVTPQ